MGITVRFHVDSIFIYNVLEDDSEIPDDVRISIQVPVAYCLRHSSLDDSQAVQGREERTL